jgi:hypothetical protein
MCLARRPAEPCRPFGTRISDHQGAGHPQTACGNYSGAVAFIESRSINAPACQPPAARSSEASGCDADLRGSRLNVASLDPLNASAQILDHAEIVPRAESIDQDPQNDQRRSEPERGSIGPNSRLEWLIPNASRNKPKRATTKPNPMSASPVRIHARNVLSAAR